MKILFVTPYIPSPLRPRPLNFIRQLARRGHEVTLLAVRSKLDEDPEEVRALCKEAYFFSVSPLQRLLNTIKAVPAGLPLQAMVSWQPAVVKHLRRLVNEGNFDLLHVEHIRAARYGLLRSHAVSTQSLPPVVWDSVDADGLYQRESSEHGVSAWRRLLAGWEAERVELYEGWLVNQFDRVLVTSERDQRWLISRQMPGDNQVDVDVLPNGVDLEYFQPPAHPGNPTPSVLLSGDMSYQGNVIMALYLVEEIMPLVWESLPETKVVIAGRNPAPVVRALTQDKRVKVTGTVDDIRPHIHQSTVAVSPLLYGLGIQNKVLEAMACAKPVVATPQAVGGLAVESEKDLLIAEDPVQFARAVVNVLQDPQLQRRLGQAGRLYVEEHHPWPAVVDKLEAVYQAVIARSLQKKSAG